jgi:hypothetical protein
VVLPVICRLAALVPGLVAPPSGGRATVTEGVVGLLPEDAVPGLDAWGAAVPDEEPAEPPERASCRNHDSAILSERISTREIRNIGFISKKLSGAPPPASCGDHLVLKYEVQ